jgi:hypothetical protein
VLLQRSEEVHEPILKELDAESAASGIYEKTTDVDSLARRV